MVRLLDLFCGAGGAGMGYSRAGFEVVGVDLKPQPRYPFEFVQADALEYLHDHGHEFDAIHASPPCQHYSRGSKQSGTGHLHPDMIEATRSALQASERPYVIENVGDARNWLREPILLCGAMFPGLLTYRHRLFETTFFALAPSHQTHRVKTPRSNVYVEGQFMTVYGHVSPVSKAREVMGIDWPMSQYEVAQTIPPAYTEFVGGHLIRSLA
jgi:DNA (cytosine-5)-methyltransferase 1